MNSRLARSAGLIGVATMASRLLGIAREVVLALMFGASATSVYGRVQRRVPHTQPRP